MKTAVKVFFVISIMLTSLVWCPSFASSEQLAENQSFRFGLDVGDLSTIDPAFATNNAACVPGLWVFNSLVRTPLGTVDLDNIEGDLAESWEISNDGKSYTFKLRKGVQWHKGWGEFTADDVKFTFDRVRDPKYGSAFAGNYVLIDNIKVLDRYTVQFNLKEPSSFLLVNQLINVRSGNIVCKKYIEEKFKGGNMGLNVIGTGPFEFVSYTAKEKLTLKKNKNYFRGEPAIENVDIFFTRNLSARTMAFIKGELDAIVGGIDPKWVKSIRKHDDIIADVVGLGSPATLHFNMTKKPLDDIRVRKALAMTMDREMLRKYFGEIWMEMLSPVPPGYLGVIPKDKIPEALLYKPNLEEAKKLLTQAGYPNGFKIEAYCGPKRFFKVPYEIAKECWKPLNVELELKMVDHVTMHANIRKNMNAVIVHLAPRPPVADIYLTQMYYSKSIVGTPTAVTNFSHYGAVDANGDGKIDSIDSLIEKARGEVDRKKQLKMYYDAQLQLLGDVPTMGLMVYKRVICRKKYFDPGVPIEASLLNSYPLEKARILKH